MFKHLSSTVSKSSRPFASSSDGSQVPSEAWSAAKNFKAWLHKERRVACTLAFKELGMALKDVRVCEGNWWDLVDHDWTTLAKLMLHGVSLKYSL